MLLAIAVFILHAPPEVVCAPNLQYPCINQFKQCLQSNNIAVSRLCFKLRTKKWAVQSIMKNTLNALSIDHRITRSFNKFIVKNKQLSHIKEFCNLDLLYV
jgi:hypothetical protein